MYEQFYNLTEKPFSVTPDTKYFFKSDEHEEALSSLLYSIQERRGFVVITGEIGSGKTTTWRVLLNKLDRTTKVALILNTHLSSKQMIMAILDEFDIPFKESWSKVRLLSVLNKFLLEQIALGINVVLIIDEAQNLSRTVLEEVRMLSNLETEREKLIQIILLGQPELREKLALKELMQLRQRIQVSFHLYPMNNEETKGYILHRLSVAGANGTTIFDEAALDKIHAYTTGVPRLINAVCDRALLNGFINDRHCIDEVTIEETIKEIIGIFNPSILQQEHSSDPTTQTQKKE